MKRAPVAAACLLVACTRAPKPPPPVAATGAPGLTVTLVWDADVDLDLYVTDPALETVYYANPRARSGGTIERDARCADDAAAPHVERVRWPAPPPGRYRVGVDFPERCGGRAREVAYRLTVQAPDRVQDTTGRARLRQRDPQALEFTVTGDTTREDSR